MKKILFLLLLCVVFYSCTDNHVAEIKELCKKGDELVENEEYELAIEEYGKAIELNSDSAINAYIGRGDAYDRLEKYKEALLDLNTAIKLDPEYAWAYRNRGVMKDRLRQSPCSDYKKACDLGYEECCDWYEDECD